MWKTLPHTLCPARRKMDVWALIQSANILGADTDWQNNLFHSLLRYMPSQDRSDALHTRNFPSLFIILHYAGRINYRWPAGYAPQWQSQLANCKVNFRLRQLAAILVTSKTNNRSALWQAARTSYKWLGKQLKRIRTLNARRFLSSESWVNKENKVFGE